MSSNVLLMNKARASHARGDFATAARGYENILRLDPRNYDAAYALAVALYQAGRLEQAAAGFAAAAQLNPRRVEPHKDRGLVLMKLGQHEAALACFEAATRLMPGSAELLLNRGIAQKNTGRIAESVESYEAALRLKPEFAEAHNNLANSLSLLGRKEEALASYQHAFALKPSYAEAYVNAAGLLLEFGQRSEAMSVLEKAIAANPRHAEAHGCWPNACTPRTHCRGHRRRHPRRAIDRTSADAFLTRAGILAADKEEEALDDYSSALALDPRNMDALLGKAGAACPVAAMTRRSPSATPPSPPTRQDARPYYRIGRSFEARKELPAAAVSYEKAAELDAAWLVTPDPPRQRAG